MNILLVQNSKLPVFAYGGTERVIWYLAKELAKKGHKISFLAAPGSECPFADCLPFIEGIPMEHQVPKNIDVIHFQNSACGYDGSKPYIVTYHGNSPAGIDRNAVFVSRNHAERHGAESYVYNGLDWDDYGPLNLSEPRTFFHFLGKAAWRVKNVRGAIDVVNSLPGERLYVLGCTRLNNNMGFRLTLSPRVRFRGMIGGEEKIDMLQHSRGLVLPVRWNEPFGLAITESLYCGAPVFGTPYGSLPELVTPEVGFLTASKVEMAECIRDRYTFAPQVCHDYARDLFNSRLMAERYIEKYEIVLNGGTLNPYPPKPSCAEDDGHFLFPFT